MCSCDTILRDDFTLMYAKFRNVSDWIERYFGWFFTNGNKVRYEAGEPEFERLLHQ